MVAIGEAYEAVLLEEVEAGLHGWNRFEPSSCEVEEFAFGEGLETLGFDLAKRILGVGDDSVFAHGGEGGLGMRDEVMADLNSSLHGRTGHVNRPGCLFGCVVSHVEKARNAGHGSCEFAAPFDDAGKVSRWE